MPSTRYLLIVIRIGLISAMEINTEFQTWWRPIELNQKSHDQIFEGPLLINIVEDKKI